MYAQDLIYKIKSNNARIDINIKSLENHFCPYEFQHPHSNIIASVRISGCGYNDLLLKKKFGD